MQVARSIRILAMVFLGVATGLLGAGEAGAADLEVLIKGIDQSEGKLQVAVYQGKADHLAELIFMGTSVRAKTDDRRIVFADLSPAACTVHPFSNRWSSPSPTPSTTALVALRTMEAK